MDISLIIFLIIVVYFVFKGYKSGILTITSRILSLLSAYAMAYIFAKPFGQWLQSNTPFEGLITYAIGGLLLFTLTSLLLGLLFSKILKIMDRESHVVGKVSSITGGLMGSFVGMLIGFFFVWFYTIMQSIYQEKKNLPITQPTKFQQTAKELAGSAVKTVVYGATKQKDLAEASAAILSNPAENIKRFKTLNQSQVMQKFFNNYSSQQALNSGNAKTVMNNPAFQKFVNQTDLIELSKQFGFSEKPAEMQKQLAIKTTELWIKINKVKTDPEYIDIVNSPEIQEMVSSSKFYALMSNAKIERMLEIISSAKTPKVIFEDVIEIDSETINDINKKSAPDKKTKIYRWVDEKGRVHYSDKNDD